VRCGQNRLDSTDRWSQSMQRASLGDPGLKRKLMMDIRGNLLYDVMCSYCELNGQRYRGYHVA
jgi:hypothetical protein